MDFDTLGWGGSQYAGIALGGIVYFALGALWYTVLFGERWIAATGRTREEFPSSSPALMVLTLVGAIVTTAVVAALYEWGGGNGIVDGLIAGLVVGIGVVAMEGLKNVVYNVDERAHVWPLYAINTAYAIAGLALAGLVYSLLA